MKKIILIVLAAVVFGVLGLLGYASLQPAKYRVVRSMTMQADANTVFNAVNDFAIWPKWSPWGKMDPTMKNVISTPSSGVGAKNSWDGKEAGVGEQIITSSAQGQHVHIDLNFMKPMESKAKVDFTFVKEGNATKVTWGMDGSNDSIVAKAFATVANMDKMTLKRASRASKKFLKPPKSKLIRRLRHPFQQTHQWLLNRLRDPIRQRVLRKILFESKDASLRSNAPQQVGGRNRELG
jgi:Polyketide cyclase / dehydrase and lipid transport